MKVVFILGTRPEAIKMAPVIKAFQRRSDFEVDICFTGQHQQMVLPVFKIFDIDVNTNLHIMQGNPTLSTAVGRLFIELGEYLLTTKPQLVFVQGDTNTAMAGALTAFYADIPVAHIEAGLRTYNMYAPFPEEFNRVAISKVATIHFTPTEKAGIQLKNEGINPENIFLTGNTGIDALFYVLDQAKHLPQSTGQQPWLSNGNKIILITGHRRENFGSSFENICHAIRKLSIRYPQLNFVYPVHLNPNVQEPVKRILADLENVFLISPPPYSDFVSLMALSYLILTDSGGIQEEAPAIGKPLLIMRDVTERPEVIESGNAKLVGTDTEYIINSFKTLMDDHETYASMSKVNYVFGDGKAAQKIYHIIKKLYCP